MRTLLDAPADPLLNSSIALVGLGLRIRDYREHSKRSQIAMGNI